MKGVEMLSYCQLKKNTKRKKKSCMHPDPANIYVFYTELHHVHSVSVRGRKNM